MKIPIWFVAFGSEFHLIPHLHFPLLLSGDGFLGNENLSGTFLPEESFWGEVSTGAPVHTVGPQDLFDQSGFHVGHSEAERRVQSTCSGTGMAMGPIPFPSFPSRCLAEIVNPLWGEVPSKSQVQCAVVCGNSHVGLLWSRWTAAPEKPPHPHRTPLDFLLWPHTLHQSALQSRMHWFPKFWTLGIGSTHIFQQNHHLFLFCSFSQGM